MTLKAFTNNLSGKFFTSAKTSILREKIFLVLIIFTFALFFFLRLYNIENRFGFDHDQEQAANAAWSIIKDQKPMLIGQETSIGALYVGPFLYWFQAIGMLIGGLNPISLSYQGIAVSFLATIVIFATLLEISNKWQALIGVFLYTISWRLITYDISGNAMSYITIVSALFTYLSIKIFLKNKLKFLPLLFLLSALTFHVHLSLITMISILPVLLVSYRKSLRRKYLIASVAIFLLPFTTFLIFDLRHDYLITKGVLSFLEEKNGISFSKTVQSILMFTNLLTEIVFVKSQYYLTIFIGAIYLFLKYAGNQKSKYILLVGLFVPLAASLVYIGQKPEYYFLLFAPTFIIITSFLYTKLFNCSKVVFMLLLTTIIFFNFREFSPLKESSLSFKLKNDIVDSIIKNTSGQNFNVYYEIPLSQNNGFSYLFKWKAREPRDYSKNLYIIDYADPTLFKHKKFQYLKTYPDKEIKVSVYGALHLISVK